MIDDCLGFSFVHGSRFSKRRLERHVSGIAIPGGHIVWTFERARELSLFGP
jgi:hypothetical protein